MRIVFCGSGSLAVPSLRAVLSARHELPCVVTQPSRPAGRGGKHRSTLVADTARELNLPLLECPDINSNEGVEAIRAAQPDIICVVDFGQMIRRQVRQLGRLGAFNLHGSLLPALRGAAPVNWAIIRGHERTGVTTFELVDEMDAGPIYLQAETKISPDETAEALRARIAEIGARVVCETIDLLATGRAEPREQDHSQATLAPRLKKADGAINFTAAAVEIRNRIHGTWPWPGAGAVFQRSSGRAIPVALATAAVEPAAAHGEPGTLDDELLVATGSGRLRIVRLRPAGKRLMAWPDFVNGYRAAAGDRFTSPGQ